MRHNIPEPAEDQLVPLGVLFVARMRQTRQELGISAEQLSRRLDAYGVRLSRDSIAQLERDADRARNIRLQDALAIALALGVAPATLLTGGPEREGPDERGCWRAGPADQAQPVAVTPRVVARAGSVRQWLEGKWPLTWEREPREVDQPTRDRYFLHGLPEAVLEARAREGHGSGPSRGLPADVFQAVADAAKFEPDSGHNGDTSAE